MKVVHRAQRGWGVGVIVQVAEEGRRLAVRFAGRDGLTVVSGRDPALVEVPADTPIEQAAGGPLDKLAAGDAGPAAAFALRTRVVRLEALRRADSLGALLSSRVHVLPHQVGAAGRILADRIPRFVLADEVGLGKTVEAGLVFAGMRQLGIAERVARRRPRAPRLPVARRALPQVQRALHAPHPGARSRRWAARRRRSRARRSPSSRSRRSATTRRSPPRPRRSRSTSSSWTRPTTSPTTPSTTRSRRSAGASFGVLLLTATPVRLDPREYFRLLSLVEPVPSTSLDEFLARLEQHEAYAEVARALLAGGSVAGRARDARASSRPGDDFFSRAEPLPDRASLLAHLADRYSLSARLVRNRRVKVGAFTARVLRRADVAGGRQARGARGAVRPARPRRGEGPRLRPRRRRAARAAGAASRGAGLEALLYDDAPSLEARDRLVARFRDPEGPMMLLSGESGGEGRNFQFAHHLVCADLPESPLVLEQRIGRLDRLGQSRPVEIHLVVEPGEEAFLADLYEKEIGIFDEPVGGLDAVLASLPEELAALRGKRRDRSRARPSGAGLAARVAAARRAQHEGDPLLDIRSASLPELAALVAAAFERMGEDPPEGVDGPEAGAAIEESLVTLSRWLEEELEELVAEVGPARRAWRWTPTRTSTPSRSPSPSARACGSRRCPGWRSPRSRHASSAASGARPRWRATSCEWFATGHRLVEALVGLVRDGEAGRTRGAEARVGAAPRRPLRSASSLRSPTRGRPRARARASPRGRPRATSTSPRCRSLVDLEAAPHAVVGGRGGAARGRGGGGVGREGRRRAARAPRGRPRPRRRRRRARCSRGAWRRRARCSLAHADAEEERLVEAAFQGGAPRGRVEAALVLLRAAPRRRREGDRPGEARARRRRHRGAVGSTAPGQRGNAPAGLSPVRRRRPPEMKPPALALLALAALVAPAAAVAHGVSVEIDRRDGAVAVRARYEGGRPLADARFEVVSPAQPERAFAAGRTDRHGWLVFVPDAPGTWRVRIADASGHGGLAEIEAAPPAPASALATPAAAAPAPRFPGTRSAIRSPFDRLRASGPRAEARRLHRSRHPPRPPPRCRRRSAPRSAPRRSRSPSPRSSSCSAAAGAGASDARPGRLPLARRDPPGLGGRRRRSGSSRRRRHFGVRAVEALPVMGSLTALAFVLQTLRIPVPGGTSVHLVGMALLALLRGPLAAFACEGLVLAVQALFFGAGGVTTLGVNALAMGLVGPGAAWLVFRAAAPPRRAARPPSSPSGRARRPPRSRSPSSSRCSTPSTPASSRCRRRWCSRRRCCRAWS